MQDYPHIYHVDAAGGPEGEVRTTGAELPPIAVTSPPEFGGPEGCWSPETLLVAAVADCFILTFRAIARASRYEWRELACTVEGTLDRIDGVTRFTEFRIRAHLKVPEHSAVEKGQRLMQKSEAVCLVTRSLSAGVQLEARVEQVAANQAA